MKVTMRKPSLCFFCLASRSLFLSLVQLGVQRKDASGYRQGEGAAEELRRCAAGKVDRQQNHAAAGRGRGPTLH